MNKFFVLPLLIAFILALTPLEVSASTLYASAARQNLKVGQTTQVTVSLNTEREDINAIATNLSYSSDKLSIESIQTSADFPILAEQTVENGQIKLAQGSLIPNNGRFEVATITFKAKAVGDAFLNFTEDSAAPRIEDSSDSLNLSQSQGTNLVITTDDIDPIESTPSADPIESDDQSQTLSLIYLWNLLFQLFNS